MLQSSDASDLSVARSDLVRSSPSNTKLDVTRAESVV